MYLLSSRKVGARTSSSPAQVFSAREKVEAAPILIEHDDDADLVWFLDLTKKRRIKGKMLYAFKQLNTEEEIQIMLDKDYEAWVEYMKSAGAWEE